MHGRVSTAVCGKVDSIFPMILICYLSWRSENHECLSKWCFIWMNVRWWWAHGSISSPACHDTHQVLIIKLLSQWLKNLSRVMDLHLSDPWCQLADSVENFLAVLQAGTYMLLSIKSPTLGYLFCSVAWMSQFRLWERVSCFGLTASGLLLATSNGSGTSQLVIMP